MLFSGFLFDPSSAGRFNKPTSADGRFICNRTCAARIENRRKQIAACGQLSFVVRRFAPINSFCKMRPVKIFQEIFIYDSPRDKSVLITDRGCLLYKYIIRKLKEHKFCHIFQGYRQL